MLISKGNPLLMGCNRYNNGYNFSFESKESEVTLLLFDAHMNKKHTIKLDASMKWGNIFSAYISGIKLDRYLYCYEVNDNLYIDPYAKAITGCSIFGEASSEALYVSPVVIGEYDWEGDTPLNLPYEDCVFYKMNVRGFTKSKTSKVKNKGTFAGIIAKIPYLKELGVTTIELQPAYEFDEINRFPQLRETILSKYTFDQKYKIDANSTKVNYWGYVGGFYFAPKASFSSKSSKCIDYTSEFKDMVKVLHANGIEVIMEMFFNKESTAFVGDCVRYWVTEYHIDGVHVYCDEATLKALASDPLLTDTKIITVYWGGDRGDRKHLANYNTDFQNIARRFLKGDENMLGEYISATKKNDNNSATINYIANNNGFTLYDLVSFDRKHNEANGENNRDGENFNFSWNCGEEGATRKKKIKELRMRQIKNALAMVILSGGTPLIMAGDEMGNSNQGNNNPYCVDSELSWVNWKDSKENKEILEWTKALLAIRKQYGILHMPEALTNSDRVSCGYPDISYHGTSAWYNNMQTFDRHIGIMYSTVYGDEKSHELVYVGYNMHWENHELALPKIEGGSWEIIMKTSAEDSVIDDDNRTVKVPPRSITILKGTYDPDYKKKTKKSTLSEAIKKNES